MMVYNTCTLIDNENRLQLMLYMYSHVPFVTAQTEFLSKLELCTNHY